jgi:ribosomal protein S18 acetylase RimI-like enzyme
MMTIRLMLEADVDIVCCIDASAFGAWWKQHMGESADLPRRTRRHLLALREKEPAGCFIAEDAGLEVGFIISRTWDGVGWFGTFAVLPECQGSGFGKQLIAASVEYLRRDSERVIGLETMPESPYNLGLYLKQDFEPRYLTLLLSRDLAPVEGNSSDLPYWSQSNNETREGWLADLREASHQLYPRLDYSKEVISTARWELGKTLVLTKGSKAIGMSVVWLVSSRYAWNEELATIQVMALHPTHTDAENFQSLINASESLARAHGKQKLGLSVNGRHTWALAKLLAWGYRVDRTMVRMVLKGTDDSSSTDCFVNLCRWAG